MCLESRGTGTLIMVVAEGATWVLAEKRPPRESLTRCGMAEDVGRWGKGRRLAGLRLLPHIWGALDEYSVQTPPWGETR